jgi:hypothetical protein
MQGYPEWSGDEQQIRSLSKSSEQRETKSIGQDSQIRTHQHVCEDVLRAERDAVITLRDQGRIDDEALHTVERELDLEEQYLSI